MVIIHRIRISTCYCDLNIRDINRSISCVDGWEIISPLIKQNSYFRVSAYIFFYFFLLLLYINIKKTKKKTKKNLSLFYNAQRWINAHAAV